MVVPSGNGSLEKKKMTKQLTGKRNDTALHHAVRASNLEAVREILSGASDDAALEELLSAQNQSGETGLYVAAECGCVELVREMLQYHDANVASIKAKNGYDALLISAKQGDVGILFIFLPLILCFS
jgi:ankyrin repeat protein